jgi:hypothetical protein
MTREQFKEMVALLEKHHNKVYEAYKLNISLHEFNDDLERVISMLLTSLYGVEGYDWISWFLYERDFGKKDLEAWDENDKPICRNIDELYDYIMREKYAVG